MDRIFIRTIHVNDQPVDVYYSTQKDAFEAQYAGDPFTATEMRHLRRQLQSTVPVTADRWEPVIVIKFDNYDLKDLRRLKIGYNKKADEDQPFLSDWNCLSNRQFLLPIGTTFPHCVVLKDTPDSESPIIYQEFWLPYEQGLWERLVDWQLAYIDLPGLLRDEIAKAIYAASPDQARDNVLNTLDALQIATCPV